MVAIAAALGRYPVHGEPLLAPARLTASCEGGPAGLGSVARRQPLQRRLARLRVHTYEYVPGNTGAASTLAGRRRGVARTTGGDRSSVFGDPPPSPVDPSVGPIQPDSRSPLAAGTPGGHGTPVAPGRRVPEEAMEAHAAQPPCVSTDR